MNSGLQVYNEQNKLAQWAQTVAQCRDSGLSVRQWCQEHGVNVSSYYKWQRKVYAAAQAQQERSFILPSWYRKRRYQLFLFRSSSKIRDSLI